MSAARYHLTREVVIRAIHHLEHPDLTPEENQKLYGLCYGRHGHDYRVKVTLAGEPDSRSGLLISRDELDQILERALVKRFDGTDLNRVFDNTACENLAREFFKILAPEFPKGQLVRVGIQETRKNYFEVSDG